VGRRCDQYSMNHLEGGRPYHHPENPRQESQPTELAKAREALIVFVAGTERNSARSKAFSNLMSERELSALPWPAQREGESDTAHYYRWVTESNAEEAKRERRVKTNTALVRGYSLERARVRVRLRDYTGEWLKGPGRGKTIFAKNRAFGLEMRAIRAEVIARQQQGRQDPPQE
jgi:hypothetical protein